MKYKVRKAIFPVGGLGTRFLPATKSMPKEMLTVVDKPLIQYAFEEARAAGIEEFIFVTGRGKAAIEDHFDHSYELNAILQARGKEEALKVVQDMVVTPGCISYIRQQEPLGLGHAVWCARNLIQNEPFAVILADDLILGAQPCLKQMLGAYDGGNMVAVMDVPSEDSHKYGMLDVDHEEGPLVVAKNVIEKPSRAPSSKAVIGRYVLHPEIFTYLEAQQTGALGEIQLTDSIARMISKVGLKGFSFEGTRFDCGSKEGLLAANIAFSLRDPDLRETTQCILKDLNNN